MERQAYLEEGAARFARRVFGMGSFPFLLGPLLAPVLGLLLVPLFSVAARGDTLRVVHPEASAGVLEREGISGTPTGILTFSVELEIAPGSLPVHAWSLGLSHDSTLLTLETATLTGTRGDVTSPGFSSLDILPDGMVSSAVLDQDHTSLLLPGSTGVLLLGSYHGTFPAKDTTVQTRLRLVDGLSGPAGPVTTGVMAWNGTADVPQQPGRENLIVLLSGFEYSVTFDVSLVTDGGIEGVDGESVKSFVRPGAHPTYPVRVALDSKLPTSATSGAQGWSLAIAHDPLVFTVDSITTAGTDAGTLMNGGFEKHELVNNGSGTGVLSAVVLSFSQPVSLQPRGRAYLLKNAYRLTGDTSVLGAQITTELQFQDKLQGQGQPVNNVITYLGESNRPLVRKGINFELEVGDPPRQAFLRSDTNNDGRLNIADPVWLVSELFFRGPPTQCAYAADANADGVKDVSDVAFLVRYHFLGGRAPPTPFPVCGVLEDEDPVRCPLGSTRCLP
jgi:hypothetical protein